MKTKKNKRAMKPKEFLFKRKGWCYRGSDFKYRKKGMIYLSHTHLRITFKNGGQVIIPLNTIKNLNFYKVTALFGEKGVKRISIQTDTDELYTFLTAELKKLYRLLSEVIANLSDGRDVHVDPGSGFNLEICFCIIVIIAGIIAIVIYALTGYMLL